jgi:ABC-type nitrate/sulfonate/bicarbonate transport system substrate-binding protein
MSGAVLKQRLMTRAQIPLTVMVFPGTQTLPLFAAQAQGFFERRGLAIDLRPAPNSEEQRNGLAAGRYPIVHGAADQCVALVEASKVDAIVVAGGDNGFNHLFVQPRIPRIADLRGRTLVADVANTGWSFVLYEILRRHGLARADITIHEAGAPFRRFEAMRDDKAMAAAILNPPFAIHARRAGLKDMGAVVDTIGPYLDIGRHPRRLSRGLHRRPALDARSGEHRRGGPAHRRTLERAARYRRENPCRGCRSGERLGQRCRLRCRGFQDRADAPRRLRGPHRRAA